MSKDLRNTLIAVALFVALASGMVYWVMGTQDELDDVVKKNADLDGQIKDNNAYIAKGPQLKAQLAELNANFRDYVKILPSAEVATEEKLLRTVQAYAEQAQIRFTSVNMQAGGSKKGGGKMGEFQEVGVNFNIDCDFDSFIRFLNLLERHEQFMKVNSFSVNPAQTPRVVEGKEIIDLGVTIGVSTYTYIPTRK
jgi:Tfp pilus assembly protein PilO